MSRAWGTYGGEKKCTHGFSGETGGENIPLEMLVVKFKKVKCTLVQALRLCTGRMARRGSRGLALLFLDHDTSRGEVNTSRI